ncbi:MAG: topoisomerase IV, partial [Ruminococcaceae bacterium]|nr:topoisomerase IV [Oscillospiraceae bacterium]
SFKVRARYQYDAASNCIDILQIPYSTTIEQIMDKIADMIKSGSLKEVTDFRDEIDLSGFKLTLDLRRGVDPDKLMAKLYRLTPLEDSFKCNFNILINSVPKQMGILEILREWINFRMGCVRRELTFDMNKKRDKLHLLEAMAKVLLDIDLAIRIIRKTEKEDEVIPALMKAFDIDEIQANFIAEIKLRNLNREHILNRISEMENLRQEIADIESILADELKLKALIAGQLTEIKKKYGQPRKTQIMGMEQVSTYNPVSEVENFPVRLILTRDGYFKKMPSNTRSTATLEDHKFKDGDEIMSVIEAENKDELVFFTNQGQVYRSTVASFDIGKVQAMGDYLPTELKMDSDERPVYMEVRASDNYPEDEYMVFIFENGKGVRIPVSAYATKGNRRKLTGAYSTASPLVAVFCEKAKKPLEILMISENDRAILIKSSLIPEKTTRTSGGVQLMNLKKGQRVVKALAEFGENYQNVKSYRKLKIPATGTLLEEKNIDIQQIKLDI